ncbi:MAG: hypothetical protein IKC80_04340 [Kiritimatiellae bacterium]|nr:hypothetical protein [Kiritimatiellia bacterium]
MKKIILAFVSAALSCVAFGAKTTCFTGRAGVEGGNLFSVAENWDNGLPAAGDTVVVSSTVKQVVNDFASGFKLKSLYLKKNETVDFAPELTGNPVVLASTLYLYDGAKNFLDVTADADNFYLGRENGECYGRIEVNGNCLLYIGNGKTLKLYGPLRVEGTIRGNTNSTYQHGSLRLCSTGNYFKTAKIWYNNVYFDVPDAVEPEFVIDWGDTNNENNKGMYIFGSNNQTANRILGTLTRTTGCQISGSGVLSLNGTEDAISPCLIQDSLSVVWNPSGDYTQTFSNRAHTTSGSLTVSNGTMRLAAGGSFKNVSKLTIAEGAVFDLATTAAETFKSLKSARVDGTFRFAPGSSNPFASTELQVDIGRNGVLEIPQGVTLHLPRVFVRGVFPKSGVYDSSSGWISGGGEVEVLNASLSSWREPVSGKWSDASKWSDGAVPVSAPTYVTAQGTSYDVEFDASVFTPPEINIGNAEGFSSRLTVAGDATLPESAETVFNVAGGGVFEVQSGFVGLTNGDYRLASVSGGGVWRICGGTNEVMTKKWGGFEINAGGTLAVTAGLFRVKNTQYSYAPGCKLNDGRIVLSGTGSFRSVNESGEFNPFGSGRIEVKDDASLYVGRAFAGPTKSGSPLEISLTDRAMMDCNAGFFLGDTLSGGETLVTVSDEAYLNLGWKSGIGINRSCRVRLDIISGASVSVGGYGFSVGGLVTKKDSSGAFPTGVVNVVNGNLYGGGGYYGKTGFTSGHHYQGCLIGSPDPSTAEWNGQARYHGEMYVGNEGTYEQSGYISLGVGCGDGLLAVDGGSVTAKGGEVLVGACDGSGRIELCGGGEMSVGSSMHLGGFDVSGLSIPRTWTMLDHDNLASTGRVSVIDGTLAVSGGVTLGVRGTGILEVGSNGVVTASSLVLSNRTASVLSFSFGADGVGSIELDGPLTVASGAKLKIDASAYRGKRGRFRLLTAESVAGAFAAGDVELDGGDTDLTAYFLDGSLFVRRHTGFSMIVR